MTARLSDEVEALFREASGRGREWLDGDSYSFRGLPGLGDKAFAKLCASLRATKWNREHPERRAEIQRGYNAKAERKNRHLASARARRARRFAQQANALLTCSECGAQFLRKVTRGRFFGPAPKFCREACAQRAYYQAKTPGARRIKRHEATS